MAETKASILRLALIMALARVKLSFRRLGLSEETRKQIADDTIRELRRYGEWKDLDEAREPVHPGPTWIDGKPPGGS